jgi:hypothetical protein
MINTNLLRKTMNIHKKFIVMIKKENYKTFMVLINKTASEICLVLSQFKCNRCGKESELQYHHLIQKNLKEFFGEDISRYLKTRYYFGNILVLCKTCHGEIHRVKFTELNKCISNEKIQKIKDKYVVQESKCLNNNNNI